MKKLFHRMYHGFFYRTSLMKKLLLSYSILICLPILILTLFSYTRLSGTLIQQFQYSSEQSLQQAQIYLNEVFEQIIDTSVMIAFHDTMSEIFQKESHSKTALELSKDYATASELISQNLTSELIHSTEIYVKKQPFYVSDHKQNNTGISFINLENSYAKTLDSMLKDYSGKLLWFPRTVQNPASKKETAVITGAKYIKSTIDYSTSIGILAVNISQTSLNSILSRVSVLPNSVSMLIDEAGNIIAISGEELFQQYALSTKLITESIQAGNSSFDSEDNTLLLNSIPLTATNWTLVSILPYEEMLKTSTDTRNSLLLFMLIVSILFYSAAYLISHLISKRLKGLSTQMKEVQFDNYTTIPPEDGSDEISDLINSYNHMLNKINDYAESQYQLGIALKTSELNALQAQINPHFLYNTLDLLHCIAWEHGMQEMSEIASLLTRFYRLSLNKGKEMIAVKDAVEQLEVYIKLQNFRFESSIQLITELQPEIIHSKILKLLLQPIVENSIIHGILEKNIQNGTVIIRGKIIEDTLQFTIIDDGVGMTEEEISKLLTSSEADTTGSSTSMGYGIKNVIERIHLYYGEEYGLTYKSQVGEGTTVIMKLPL